MFKKFLRFLGSLVAVAITAFVTSWAGAKGQQFAGARA